MYWWVLKERILPSDATLSCKTSVNDNQLLDVKARRRL